MRRWPTTQRCGLASGSTRPIRNFTWESATEQERASQCFARGSGGGSAFPLSQAAGAGTPGACTYVPLPPVSSGRPQRPSAPYPPPPFPRRVACFCFLHSTFRRISKNTRENTGKKKRQLRSGALIDTHTPDCSYLSCIGVVREKHSSITPWCSPGASARGACAAASARSR